MIVCECVCVCVSITHRGALVHELGQTRVAVTWVPDGTVPCTVPEWNIDAMLPWKSVRKTMIDHLWSKREPIQSLVNPVLGDQ